MTKDDFFNELQRRLEKLPATEREEILADYEEHFQHAQFEGKEEQEILASLGSPRKLSKELLADYYLGQAKEKNSYANLLRAVFKTLGLGFFNLIFVIGPFLAVIGVLLALMVVSVALILTPFAMIGSAIWIHDWLLSLLGIFITFMLAGIGLMLGAGVIRFSKAFYRWFTNYLQSNLRLIRGVQKNE
ncbi:Uncharacterized membrane protein [Seinonella peptonophila]|uniref:Uncharacterized membrane protein n=1 Tax=Seinonella peptonophila TaxID=112248 RepID=A0A1M4U915_9BACL|nr:DUF1700 domain-containing protein [Seinonella peptonophila]SHE53215.1 Uncharacterized membrane protein [Seinonella peptonophila]